MDISNRVKKKRGRKENSNIAKWNIYIYNQQLCRMFKHNKIKTAQYYYSKKRNRDRFAISKCYNNNTEKKTQKSREKKIKKIQTETLLTAFVQEKDRNVKKEKKIYIYTTEMMYTHPAELLIFAYLHTNRYTRINGNILHTDTHMCQAMSLVSKSLRIHNILHYVCNFQLNFGLCLFRHTHTHTHFLISNA